MYLPTSWCKKYNINSDTKVSLNINNDGSISIFPEVRDAEKKTINLTLPEATPEVMIKLIMACYANPTQSFNIKLEKEAQISKILDKKKVISALEFVELDGNNITHESSIIIKDPHSLLITMVKKIKSLAGVMLDHYDAALINKYEEEIDRSNLLITKSVISSLVLNEPTKLRTIELHYISLISLELERMADSLILVERSESKFLKNIHEIVDSMKELLQDIKSIKVADVIDIDKSISQLKTPKMENLKTYGLRRIKKHFSNISEVFFDWAISTRLEKNK